MILLDRAKNDKITSISSISQSILKNRQLVKLIM